MGVNRTDYLMWGAQVDPKAVSNQYEELEKEIDGAPEKRFDLVYDGMCGEYAVAGRIVASSDEYEGLEFKVISHDDLKWDHGVVTAVRKEFPEVHEFSLILFSHFS